MTGKRRWRWAWMAALLLGAAPAAAEEIVGGRYAEPVQRYGHFALGRPHEYARLTATTDAGRAASLQLPEDEVFEDLAPRLVRLEAGAPPALLVIVSRRDAGARLALVGLRGDVLRIVAQSPAIGTPNRWLNPVGVADLDGDGHAEIAAVITPHIGGVLKVFRRRGADLVELAALPGFSNHAYGTEELGLSMPLRLGGRMHLLVPDAQRLQLRVIALERGRLVEVSRCALPSQLVGALRMEAPSVVSAGLLAGRQTLALDRCGR